MAQVSTLDPTNVDTKGNPLPKLDYRSTTGDRVEYQKRVQMGIREVIMVRVFGVTTDKTMRVERKIEATQLKKVPAPKTPPEIEILEKKTKKRKVHNEESNGNGNGNFAFNKNEKSAKERKHLEEDEENPRRRYET